MHQGVDRKNMPTRSASDGHYPGEAANWRELNRPKAMADAETGNLKDMIANLTGSSRRGKPVMGKSCWFKNPSLWRQAGVTSSNRSRSSSLRLPGHSGTMIGRSMISSLSRRPEPHQAMQSLRPLLSGRHDQSRWRIRMNSARKMLPPHRSNCRSEQGMPVGDHRRRTARPSGHSRHCPPRGWAGLYRCVRDQWMLINDRMAKTLVEIGVMGVGISIDCSIQRNDRPISRRARRLRQCIGRYRGVQTQRPSVQVHFSAQPMNYQEPQVVGMGPYPGARVLNVFSWSVPDAAKSRRTSRHSSMRKSWVSGGLPGPIQRHAGSGPLCPHFKRLAYEKIPIPTQGQATTWAEVALPVNQLCPCHA